MNESLAVAVEYIDDPPPPCNTYWDMWGLPLFGAKTPDPIICEINKCRDERPKYYVKVNSFDNKRGIESAVLSYIAHRPDQIKDYEPGFRLVRAEMEGRKIGYTLESYAVNKAPAGSRYS